MEPFYPILYLDAIIIKARDGHQVQNPAAHIAVGVDTEGIKHVLGIWVEASEGAKFWAGVCAELANRGVKHVLIVCCDGDRVFRPRIGASADRLARYLQSGTYAALAWVTSLYPCRLAQLSATQRPYLRT